MARGEAWLAHCYGMVGAGRGNAPDSGNGAELYVVTGHAPRQLDRNIALVGRVVQGIELLSTQPRGSGPMGFYEKAEQTVPITSVRVAADLPVAERASLEVMRTDTERFRQLVEARRNRRDDWYLVPAGTSISATCLSWCGRGRNRTGDRRLRGKDSWNESGSKHYPAGVPHDVDITQYSSLVELIEHGLRQHAQRNAYAYMDRYFTFGEIDRYSAAFGAWLQSRGLAKGARVAIMMPNVVQYPIALAGVLRAGYVVVNVNPLYTPRELEHQLRDSGAEAIVILENFARTLQQVIARTDVKHVVVASLGEMLGFPKGAIVNFAVRRVKKLVPAYTLPGHLKFTDDARRSARAVASSR